MALHNHELKKSGLLRLLAAGSFLAASSFGAFAGENADIASPTREVLMIGDLASQSQFSAPVPDAQSSVADTAQAAAFDDTQAEVPLPPVRANREPPRARIIIAAAETQAYFAQPIRSMSPSRTQRAWRGSSENLAAARCSSILCSQYLLLGVGF